MADSIDTFTWADVSAQARMYVFSSLTSRRIPFLGRIRHLLKEPHDDLVPVAVVVLKTYNYYQDSESRAAVIGTLQAFIAADAKFLGLFIKFIANEAGCKSALAVTDYLTLLSWLNAFPTGDKLEELISNQALVLDRALSQTTVKASKHIARIAQAALTSTRTAVAHRIVETGSVHPFVKVALDLKNTPATTLYLGVVAEAVHQLEPSHPKYAAELDRQSIVDFYTKEVVLGKVAPYPEALTQFGAFVHHYLDEPLAAAVLPQIEKAILRSSETAFSLITIPFFTHLHVSLASYFPGSKLLTHILNGLKSPKPAVRDNAATTFHIILRDSSLDLEPVVKEVIKALKGTSNAEAKYQLAHALAVITPSPPVSALIVAELSPLAAKDQNEGSMLGLVDAFVTHYFVSPSEAATKVLDAGLSDKKLPLRRIWFHELGRAIYDKKQSTDLLPPLWPTLLRSFQEGQASPLPTITAKGILCSYVTIALAKDDADGVFSDSFKRDKFSLLLSPEVLTKLSGTEVQWAARALLNALPFIDTLDDEARVLYGVAWLYFTASTNICAEDRLGVVSLFKVFETSPHAAVVARAIDTVLLGGLSDDYNFNVRLFAPLLPVVVRSNPEHILRTVFVSAHHPSIKVKNEWIGLAQRAGVDLASLVRTHGQQFLDAAYGYLGTPLAAAAIRAIATVSLVAPVEYGPRIAARVEANLDPASLSLDATTIAIWKAPEGEVVVDVLNTAKKTDSRDKDSKWEEELKRELAAKKTRKLTRDEQKLVNEQLAKESASRAATQQVVETLTNALLVVQELSRNAVSIDNGAKFWFPKAVASVLAVLKKPAAGELLGDVARETFLELGQLLSPRFGAMKRSVGTCLLAINKVPGEEPVSVSLTETILYQVKLHFDRTPLDAITLTYLLPLLSRVLEVGQQVAMKNSTKTLVTSEYAEEDPEEEQLLLAIDIIGRHAELFEDDSIPRTNILQVLISLMGLAAKAKIAKECFLSLCLAISLNLSRNDTQLLLDNIITPKVFVKTTILEGFDSEFDFTGEEPFYELWVAAHDNDHHVAELAATVWSDSQFALGPDAVQHLLKFAGHPDQGIRVSVAKSIQDAVTKESFSSALTGLIALLRDKKDPPPPETDEYGLVIRSSAASKDPWEERSTVALTLKQLAPLFSHEEHVEQLFKFLVEEQVLADREDLVRQELQDAGVEIIKIHGLNHIETLIPVFEQCLAAKDTGSRQQDNLRECVIILYGALGRHLDAGDARLALIVDRLIKTLSTPSEDVQYAVSECIAPLVKTFSGKLELYFDQLFDTLFNGKGLAARRGAAYGIAGLVKGAGLKSLATHDIIRTLTDAADDKKNAARREGVSFAFECLSQSLGKFFEPYVIEILPILLKSLGDAVPEVRDATDLAARQIMKNTTSFGVKKLIPVAISNLDEIAWRSKKGSVELLGSMAYLDPIQLSASLLTIVPEIVGVLNDTHKEVRKAADQALKRFGEVIRNPEIQLVVPDLIQAIGDPTKYTDVALDKLIKTQFVHYIDGPSLALIIHVIHRGMKDRSASTKKKACQIVGNMAILVDSRDLQPYLPELVGELEEAMVDPVPATRSTAARALGSLVEKLGEQQFPDLIPRLLDTLQDERKAGDRLGSAQALSEVVCGLGTAKLDELFPTILAQAQSPRAHVRAGFMPLLLFLPVCFGSQFAPYLSQVVPPILAGLADSDEEIRDTALRAGRLIVKNYANRAVDLLLPELERGMSDSSYRIRLSSVELTGDLLFSVSGLSKNSEATEEETQNINKSLVDVLGQDRRDIVLSSLFICRSDVTGIVRNAAVDIWKALVPNTPRAVKEVLPTLTGMIVKRLASSDESQRTIAAATLGEMVRRVGANALAQLLPTLEETLASSTDADTKQGICIALHELVTSASLDAIGHYKDTFIRIVREALVDPAPSVRAAAASAFDVLQTELGKVVIDEILPRLLNMLSEDDKSENALLALRDIMATKADTIFPILIPTLLTPPIDAFKAGALSSLASVAGHALYKRLLGIINTLVDAVISSPDDDEIKASFDQVLLAIDDDAGVHPLMQQLLSLVKHEDSEKRAVVYGRLGHFFSNTVLDYSMYTQDMVSQFVLSLDDKTPAVVQGTVEALTALVKAQPKDLLDRLVKPARQALNVTGVRGEELAGFQLPRGPNCILPVFLHGLMYGNNEQKELSALSIADIIEKTPAAVLKPFATVITGPLIRIIGEKVTSDIKAAILIALTSLLKKIPQFLRPFIPQLQRTFVRSLGDATNETLRDRAVVALGVLIAFQPRVDSLVTELVAGAKNADANGVKTAMLKAMLQVVSKAGANMSEASKTAVMSLVEEEISYVTDDKAAVSYARLIGPLSKILSSDEAEVILSQKILTRVAGAQERDLKFAVLSVNSFLKDAPEHIFNTSVTEQIVQFLCDTSNTQFPYITDNATVAIGKLLLQAREHSLDDDAKAQLVAQLCKNATVPPSNSLDTRRLALVVLRTVARLDYSTIKPHWNLVVPNVFGCVRDVIIPIRLAAEKAFLALFNLVEDVSMSDFNEWFAEVKEPFTTLTGTSVVPRSIGDYVKRVASRLAGVERERIDAGGDDETLYSDRIEDEQEVWAIGGVDISKE